MTSLGTFRTAGEPAAPPAAVLLGRAERTGDLREAACRLVQGRRVLVTGAAGSVGTPLVQLLLQAAPAELVLVDHHEYSLFGLERALIGVGGDRAGVSFELLDVRDPAGLERLVRQRRPQVVVHLAAAKHVPYGERFPEGAFVANVLATRRLLELALGSGAETFVYPSSDKSVAPPSLYGATKRLAEGLVQLQAARSGAQAVVVRYVNILGTRGSVIETFTQQVLADAPLSITDERMTRYWISMDEALWTLLVGARLGQPGQVIMPACGEPVAILQTARRLAGWYRPERVPYPIRSTGARPGERLHEVLLSHNEDMVEVEAALGLRLVRSRREPARLEALPARLDELAAVAERGDRAALRVGAMQAAEELQ